MQVFIVIGARGTGKTTLLKQRVAKFNGFKHIYDLQRVYYSDNRPLPTIEDFTKQAATLEDSLIVYEESTIFFPNHGNNKHLRQNLVQARYNRNTIFLVYHSICAVPYYVYDLADCIILFRTQDEENRVVQKYEKFHKHWRRIIHRPETCLQFNLLNGNKSPYLIIKL
jgi:hypothetical protein